MNKAKYSERATELYKCVRGRNERAKQAAFAK